jgi:hypothetical protein
MHSEVGTTPARGTQRTTTAEYVRDAWTRNPISERDRRDFEESLKAQAERLDRTSNARRR